ncbi:MAG: NAD-dependent epimerase/dehydratase family protein, partial [Anaerolineales bacterium]
QTRCFLHVRDAVRAIIALSETSEADGRVFNIGDTQEISILNLARKVVQMTAPEEDKYEDPDNQIEFIPYDQAYAEGFEDMHRRVPDVSRIYDTVGWESDCQLENILNDVILDISQTSKSQIAVPVK